MKTETIVVGILAFVMGILAAVTIPRYFKSTETDITNMEAPANPSGPSVPSQEIAQVIDHIQSLIKTDPENSQLRVQLGNAYFDNGQFDKAITEYEKALEKIPNDADVRTDFAICYRNMGNYDKAVQEFEKAAASNPMHVNSRYNAGVVYYYDLKNYPKAKEVWESYLKIAPNDQRAGEIQKLLMDIAGKIGK
ncbi:MAG: tetratricopeptide repeat protein [Candidatus Schekmanbacteria bacterium]|nr:tetratricopeptide repeat protein [Candidatus Schekmanbacteria bacterium]